MPDLGLIKDIISISLVVISLLFFLVSWILKRTNNAKLIDLADKLENAAKNALSLNNIAQTAIAKAEKFLDYSSEDKKAWATNYIMEYCKEHNINYTEEEIDRIIEQLITFSKQVNVK